MDRPNQKYLPMSSDYTYLHLFQKLNIQRVLSPHYILPESLYRFDLPVFLCVGLHYKVIVQMTKHPLTDAGIEKFQADYKAVFGE